MRDPIQIGASGDRSHRNGLPASRSVLLASADGELRQRLRDRLAELRWSVREASGGAEAIARLDEERPEALLLDGWLPDLEVGELENRLLVHYPEVELLRMDGDSVPGAPKSPRRQELLQVLRQATDHFVSAGQPQGGWRDRAQSNAYPGTCIRACSGTSQDPAVYRPATSGLPPKQDTLSCRLPELVGESAPMLELCRLIRLVAPRSTTVLIEGETGTGKEVVAHALHRLSTRCAKPFAVLNCAAIPESLLEAELFGHARGAFTGAVGARVGRIEAAHGGTLFLDEIGEMALSLQAKMLRFLECGELQRVGDNEVTRVDVRVIAATHQELERRSAEGTFRLDLYHRLAVFPLDVPALRERLEDIPALVQHLSSRLASGSAPKPITAEALNVLHSHTWPGNVRELAHVLERAVILSADELVIGASHIRYRRRER